MPIHNHNGYIDIFIPIPLVIKDALESEKEKNIYIYQIILIVCHYPYQLAYRNIIHVTLSSIMGAIIGIIYHPLHQIGVSA